MEKEKPLVLIGSPPCTPFSQLQTLNPTAPKSKAKGTHNPGDLQVAYSSLLNGDLTFLSAGEDENMSEELLGFFDSQNRLSVTAQVATIRFLLPSTRTTEERNP